MKEADCPCNYFSLSAEETCSIGQELGASLRPGSIVCLYGDLGAGKTTLLKGLVKGAAAVNSDEVSSPTFSYLNIYEGKGVVYHFDLYRLKSSQEFLLMGFDEYLFTEGICCIEWPERIIDILPADCWEVRIDHAGEGRRKLTIIPPR